MALIEYEVRDKLAYITFNRPEKLNAFNSEMLNELAFICDRYDKDPNAWVAILSGKGRSFSGGADLADVSLEKIEELFFKVLNLKKPLIAAIHGYCIAPTAAIVFCCDIRIAADGTKFGWPQTKMGNASMCGPTFLAHGIPRNYALEYLFTGEFFDVHEAFRFGMLNRVVPEDKLMPTSEEMAGKILKNAPLAVRGMKEATLMGLEMPFAQRLRLSRLIAARIRDTNDAQEGLLAFKEKREPVWSGE
jgi:enoyl-CoA hydratase/carnithine racemase